MRLLGDSADAIAPQFLRLDPLDRHGSTVRCERAKAPRIRRQDGPRGFGHRDNDGVHRRPLPSTTAQPSGPSSKGFGHLLHDLTGVEQPILGGITRTVTTQAFYQDDRRNRRRPQPFLSKSKDQRNRGPRTFGKATHRARIQNEHGLPCLACCALRDPLSNCLCSGSLCRLGLANLRDHRRRISIRFCQQVTTPYLGTHGLL